MWEDNQGCIKLSDNPVFHKRTKHIGIKYHFIRERIESGEVSVDYVATGKQQADCLTKTLEGPKLIQARDEIMGDQWAICSPPPEQH